MTELEVSEGGDEPPPYMIFVVVFLFFLTGLFGFLVCHLLKKKGYRCRTGELDDEEGEEEKIGINADEDDEENQDTVEQILKCIIENEANMEAFNEMFGNQNVCVRHDPRLRKESLGGVPPHHHTVHSGTGHNSCHLCAQVRSKKGRRQSRTPRIKQRPGEQTVFSVGRFRVIHTDKKLHGGPNPLGSSGDQLDQSQDSEERKEGVYNLRSMFDGSNGVAPNVGKRKKSVSIFGLRRGSDPSGIKVREGTGRDTAAVRLAIQQQPVVLEELLPAENIEVASERGTKPGIKLEAENLKNETPASPQHENKTSASANSPSSKAKDQSPGSKSGPENGSKHEPSPQPHTSLGIKPSVGITSASAPTSLVIPSFGQASRTEDKVSRNEDAFDSEPLQTSTPIAPMHGSISGLTPVLLTVRPEPCSSTGFTVTKTPTDPSSSADLESVLSASQVLISLGSSSPSSFPIKTPSSDTSLKTHISPVVTASPKLSLRNTPPEATKTTISPALTPSPKLPSGRAMTSLSPVPSSSFGKSASPLQVRTPSPALTPSPKLPSGRVMTNFSPVPSSSFGKSASPLQGRTPSPAMIVIPRLDTVPVSPQHPSSTPADGNRSFRNSPGPNSKSGSLTSITSLTKQDMLSIPLSPKEQVLEGARTPTTEEKTESQRVGILKTAKLSPVEGDSPGSALCSPPDQLSKDRLSSLPLSPSTTLSPSSPVGGRISSVTVVKASPDSSREFSVESSSLIKDQKGENSEIRIESERAIISLAYGQGGNVFVSGVGQPESQSRETPVAEVRPTVVQEKEDMVEMEDIRDCKVSQEEEAL
ncbi:RELT-like protein 2 [Notothenia coriiceps]|uniref:RELT-like protein 2 n=1 Tax=Notothenia coriiceps TaxID=8208 RepID=A0A6I9NNV2_9TELE|nr:PREDICTED: mucin-5AC-like [Notothenia coriiceps]